MCYPYQLQLSLVRSSYKVLTVVKMEKLVVSYYLEIIVRDCKGRILAEQE